MGITVRLFKRVTRRGMVLDLRCAPTLDSSTGAAYYYYFSQGWFFKESALS